MSWTKFTAKNGNPDKYCIRKFATSSSQLAVMTNLFLSNQTKQLFLKKYNCIIFNL